MSSAGPGRREVAHRVFAAEYDDATLEYAESDEERAPNYVVLPSGARVNRIFVVGVLTAVEQVNEDTVRARIADPTGAFVVYAGQYQPDELAALQSMESPAFVAVTGKANTFSPEGSDRVLTSVRPESVTEVDADTRDRWVVATAEHTLARIQTAADALGREERGAQLRAALLRDGVEPGLAEGIPKAIDHYGTTADYLDALRDLGTQALEVVADERSEVDPLALAPEDGDGGVAPSDLSDLLDDEHRGVARAGSDVDVEALLETEASDADGAPDADEATDAEESAESEENEESETSQASGSTPETSETSDEDAGESADSSPTSASSSEAAEPEPVTSETAAERTAEDTEAATEDEEDEATPEAEPETSEAAAEETAADAAEAADAGDDGPADESGDDAATSESDDADDGEPYEMDDDEREEIEDEYGVGFQSGTEVEPAGEAGIETDDLPPTEDDESTASGTESAGKSSDGGDDGDDTDGESDETEDGADLEGPLLAEMEALDDGDGADRDALIDAVAEETGADADAIDDAIDDLLMSGQCYEPGDGQLKPI